VKGGVTTFIPYLMATEPFETIFDDVVAVTERGTRIDFGYHFIISTEAQLSGVADYIRDYGVPTFKIFMNNRGGEQARTKAAAAKARGVKLGNPNGARALRGKQTGNREAEAAIRERAQEHAENLRSILDDIRGDGTTSVRQITE
jgi:hypothetical protein